MLTRRRSSLQRRALNQVWTAAGRYDFEPLFLAMGDGAGPDLYMNGVVGLAWRRFGSLSGLFGQWEGDRRQGMLDDLCWLALESAVFALESPERAALEGLRERHAREFFAGEYQLSRQEWMAKNQLVYTLQAARWRKVLGRRPPVMTPREKRLSEALEPGGVEDPEVLCAAVLEAFRVAGLYQGGNRAPQVLRLRLRGRWAGIVTRLAHGEIRHTDVLAPGRSAGGGGAGACLDPRRAGFKLTENPETDRDYIESSFGRSLYPPHQLALLEQELCTGDHFGCRLWFTAGTPEPELAKRRETKYLIQQSALQCRRNREAYRRDGALYQNALVRLTEQIRSCLQVHSQAEAVQSREGRLDSGRVWRAAVLEDRRVFTREEPSARPGFSVDLLLDASSSRLHCQETVAAQGYVLSESLCRCGIPVRVSAFCSLRGYTVIRILRDYGERNGQGIFRYFASGWNRDGLALRAAGRFLEGAPEGRRLLLLLTDASPNDSRRLPAGEGRPLGRDYTSAPAVEDAAREVRELRRRGIQVSAVFMGESGSVPDARRIYGRSLARIQGMDQLAAAAGRLIQNEIRELSL